MLTGTFYACLYYVPTYFARKMCKRTDVHWPILRIRHFTFATSPLISVQTTLISPQTKTIWRYATVDRFFAVPHTSRHLHAVATVVWCLTTVTCNRQTHVHTKTGCRLLAKIVLTTVDNQCQILAHRHRWRQQATLCVDGRILTLVSPFVNTWCRLPESLVSPTV